jgi:MFS family permease
MARFCVRLPPSLAHRNRTEDRSEQAGRTRLPGTYWRLWWATAIDNIGDGVFVAAVPLLAITITRDPRLISIVSAATYLPWLLLSVPSGALVDRLDRVALMWRAQAAAGVIVAVVGALAVAGHASIALLAAMGFGLGACDVLFANAAQTILPDLVPKADLQRANGRQYTMTALGQMFLGPPVGSLLFAVAVALPFGLDAGSFALSAALLTTLPRRPRQAGEHLPMRTALAEGLRWLARHRLLRTLALIVSVNTFCYQLGYVTLVLLATQDMHVSSRGYGLLLAGAAVGSVTGSLINTRLVARLGPLPALLCSLVANIVIFEAIGVAPDAVALGALLALNGLATSCWNIVSLSLRQQVVPAELLGRVNSVYRTLSTGLMPFGALAGGLIAHEFGLRAAYPMAGGLRAIALLIGLPVLLAEIRAVRTQPAH